VGGKFGAQGLTMKGTEAKESTWKPAAGEESAAQSLNLKSMPTSSTQSALSVESRSQML